MSLDHPAFAELLGRPDAPDVLRDGSHGVVVVSGEGDIGETARRRLATIPSVIVALGSPVGPPDWADVVVSEPSTLDRITATVDARPRAAAAFVLLMRGAAGLDIGGGLVAESAVYSMLQGGPEFGEWRAGRPIKERRPSVVQVTRDVHRLVITLDRPEVHNAFDTAMRDGLVDALQLAAFDPTITSVELSGNGPSFCAGGDLDEFGSRPDPATAHVLRLERSVGRLLAELADRLTVHIHGSTMGSGIEMAAFARNVVARHDTRIALPEISLGLIPGAGGTVSLPRRIGRHRTALLALTGTEIDASTALRWGLVDRVIT